MTKGCRGREANDEKVKCRLRHDEYVWRVDGRVGVRGPGAEGANSLPTNRISLTPPPFLRENFRAHLQVFTNVQFLLPKIAS